MELKSVKRAYNERCPGKVEEEAVDEVEWLLKDWNEEEEKTGTQIKEASPGWVGVVGVVENVWRLEEVGLQVRVVGWWWCRCRWVQVGSPSGTLGRGLVVWAGK